MTQENLKLDNIPTGASVVSVAVQRLSRLLISELGKVISLEKNMSLVHWRIVLGISMENGIVQKDLVEFTQMEQGQVSRSLADLEQRGFVRSERSEMDKRARLFFLTTQGKDFFDSLLPTVAAYCQSIDDVLSPEELESYLEMSKRIAQASHRARVALERDKLQTT